MFSSFYFTATAGPLAIGVPGEMKGYWEAHQKYGRLPWEEVIKPSIEVCVEGYIMNKHQYDSLGIRADYVRRDPILRETFVNPETGEFYRYGDRIRPKKYCETLKLIAKNGGNDFYNGTLAKMLVSDIQEMGGIITEEDLLNYRYLCQVYGPNIMSKQMVRRWCGQFSEGRQSVYDEERSGRLSLINDDRVELVRQCIMENHRFTITELSSHFPQISRFLLHEIVTKHLLFKKVGAALTFLQPYHDDGDEFLDRIVTGDETWISHFTPETKQQSMHWRHSGSPVRTKFKQTLSVRKVMCTVFWDRKGILLIDFLPRGETVDADRYCETLRKLRRDIQNKRRGMLTTGVVLLHDNARPHMARRTAAVLTEFGWKLFVHPPYSPDFAPSDFHVFLHLKKFLSSSERFGNDEELKTSVTRWFHSQAAEFYDRGIQKLIPRYDKVKWENPISVTLRDQMTLFSNPPPGSGILLGFILNILDGYNFTSDSIKDINSTVLTYHRIIEAFKFAYARRTELADPDYVNITSLLTDLQSHDYADDIRQRINDSTTYVDPRHYGVVNYTVDDHGTAHISIIAPNGDAASITSTVNIYFGAGITSQRTGIILNSGMSDFSIPGAKDYFGIPFSSANAIAPGKRALSSMSPSIIVDGNGDVRLVIGASGGTKITTAVAYVIMRILWFGEGIKQAVDASRIHNQVLPMDTGYDYGVLDQVVKGLERLGHKMDRIRDRGSIICALFKLGDMIIANADYRKGGTCMAWTEFPLGWIIYPLR
ncbi:hypothetical protein ANN_07670 [Periplaneta americana]|uniref:Uncharacterized protein n=1 Tax=Periplaneta americana TaxID=6978 RepID=A0ABQ8T0M3_PERAM|nr:hypothetical protein ANN_07670 [Periplaneta americana]